MLGVLVIMLAIAVIQTPVLVRRKMRRELIAFSVIWLFATVYASLIAAGVPIPNPNETIIFLMTRLMSK